MNSLHGFYFRGYVFLKFPFYSFKKSAYLSKISFYFHRQDLFMQLFQHLKETHSFCLVRIFYRLVIFLKNKFLPMFWNIDLQVY